MISFVWFISFASNCGSLIIFDAMPYKTAWNCRPTISALVDFIYQIYVTLILLIIPLAIMTVLYGNVIFTLKTGIRFDMNLAVSMHSLDCGNNIYGPQLSKVNGRNSPSGWIYDAIMSPAWITKSFTDINANGLSSLKVPSQSLSNSRASSFSVPANATTFQPNRLMSAFSTSSVSFLCNTRKAGDFDSAYLLRSTHQQKILLAKKRVTRMLIILVIAYVLCWTPSFVWWLLIKTVDLVDVSDKFTKHFALFSAIFLRNQPHIVLVQRNERLIHNRAQFSIPDPILHSLFSSCEFKYGHLIAQEANTVWNHSLNTVITVLTYISTCTNPITYCFMNASFRKNVFSHCFCCPKLTTYPQRRSADQNPDANDDNIKMISREQQDSSGIRIEPCGTNNAGGYGGPKTVPEIEVRYFGSETDRLEGNMKPSPCNDPHQESLDMTTELQN
ncbi:unnamed protein product [Anisakis simplex]|uniref:G_PROTEIN_RECEP_F1_2 domain-containing protein n=1 Tax=Anisakis simplex TaxID=6269 RepID=A0A0M3IZS8_ANISI|nr:unnamed protein product [Anisakis simplex]